MRKTGIGYCVAINTLHVSSYTNPGVKLFVNRSVSYGDLIIDIPINSNTKKYFPTESTVCICLFSNLEMKRNKDLHRV